MLVFPNILTIQKSDVLLVLRLHLHPFEIVGDNRLENVCSWYQLSVVVGSVVTGALHCARRLCSTHISRRNSCDNQSIEQNICE